MSMATWGKELEEDAEVPPDVAYDDIDRTTLRMEWATPVAPAGSTTTTPRPTERDGHPGTTHHLPGAEWDHGPQANWGPRHRQRSRYMANLAPVPMPGGAFQ